MTHAAAVAQRLGQKLAAGLLRLPPQMLTAGRRPAEAAGLNPEAWMIARIAAADPRTPLERLPVDRARARSSRDLRLLGVPVRGDVRMQSISIPGRGGMIPARMYTGEGAQLAALLVYFHGGGWVLGDLDDFDATCSELAHASACRVLSVDYRLAPEHPFPAAADDAFDAYCWALSQADTVAVGGDSAGGNLAAVTAIAAREAAIARPAFQLLLYPICDIGRESRTYAQFADGYVLTASLMRWFIGHYVPEEDRRRDSRVSPLVAADLRELAPAFVATGLTDPLREEGQAYAARLRQAGVPVQERRLPLVHGFASMLASRACRTALFDAARALACALTRPEALADV